MILLTGHGELLRYPPRYILFKPDETRAASLPGLPEGVFPIEPITCKYTIDVQGRTAVIVDLAKPPNGKLTPFGAYVALSRSRGRDTIRLLRDFEDKIFRRHGGIIKSECAAQDRSSKTSTMCLKTQHEPSAKGSQ